MGIRDSRYLEEHEVDSKVDARVVTEYNASAVIKTGDHVFCYVRCFLASAEDRFVDKVESPLFYDGQIKHCIRSTSYQSMEVAKKLASDALETFFGKKYEISQQPALPFFYKPLQEKIDEAVKEITKLPLEKRLALLDKLFPEEKNAN